MRVLKVRKTKASKDAKMCVEGMLLEKAEVWCVIFDGARGENI